MGGGSCDVLPRGARAYDDTAFTGFVALFVIFDVAQLSLDTLQQQICKLGNSVFVCLGQGSTGEVWG